MTTIKEDISRMEAANSMGSSIEWSEFTRKVILCVTTRNAYKTKEARDKRKIKSLENQLANYKQL